MENYQTVSVFGGKEILSIYSPNLKTSLDSLLDSINLKKSRENNYCKAMEKYIKKNNFINIETVLLKSSLRNIKYESFWEIDAFFNKEILIYPSCNQKTDFFLDLIILGYFHSINLFKVGLIFPGNHAFGKYDITPETMVEIINDPILCLPKFPAIFFII
jgi:hypothetical protein